MLYLKIIPLVLKKVGFKKEIYAIKEK